MSELTDEQLKFIGKPQFHRSVRYTYNQRTHSFYFYTPTNNGREMTCVGMFCPIVAEDIPYDPSEVVETIADIMSQSNQSFDFDFQEFSPPPQKRRR